MALTFKGIADAVLGELGFPVQDQYFGNSSTQDKTLPALANRSIKSLIQDGYTPLKKAGSITMTSATSYDLPSDYNWYESDTLNAQNQERLLTLPTTSQHWYWLQSRNGIEGLRYKTRIIGDQLEVNSPQSGVELIFEYHTKNVISSTGSPSPDKERFSVDTDTWLLDDDLLILDLKWRYMQAKGLEWQVPLAEFKSYKSKFMAHDGGSQTIHMGMPEGDHIVEPYIDPWQ